MINRRKWEHRFDDLILVNILDAMKFLLNAHRLLKLKQHLNKYVLISINEKGVDFQLIYVALAILPAMILLSWLYTKDTFHPEPKQAVYRLFLLGAAIVLPAGLLERAMMNSYHLSQNGLTGAFIVAFFVAGFVEEFLKASIVEKSALQKYHVQRPMDFIIYAGAVALGFATIENILYVTGSGFETAILRSVTAVPAHFMFGITMGYQFSLAFLHQKTKILAYVLPAIEHGIYDTFALYQSWMTDILLVIYLLTLIEISLKILDKVRKLENAFTSQFQFSAKQNG